MSTKKTKSEGSKTHTTAASAASDADGDVARGEKAFGAVEPRLAAVKLPKIPRRVSFELAALAATGVAARIGTGDLAESFALLPKKLFDPAHAEQLGDLAWGTYYAARRYAQAKAGHTDAKLPEGLVTRASTIEGRMQRLLEYHFADDAALGPRLKFLASGSGYRDLASDLQGYAEIYDEQAAVVKSDRKNYVATDARDAVAAAEEMLELLTSAETKEAQLWHDRARRAFELLEPVYRDVRATGLWIEREDPGAEARYPTLYGGQASGGKTRGAAKDGPGNSAAAPGLGGADAGGEGGAA